MSLTVIGFTLFPPGRTNTKQRLLSWIRRRFTSFFILETLYLTHFVIGIVIVWSVEEIVHFSRPMRCEQKNCSFALRKITH